MRKNLSDQFYDFHKFEKLAINTVVKRLHATDFMMLEGTLDSEEITILKTELGTVTLLVTAKPITLDLITDYLWAISLRTYEEFDAAILISSHPYEGMVKEIPHLYDLGDFILDLVDRDELLYMAIE